MQKLPHLKDFILSLQINGCADKTIYAYERKLRIFSNFLQDKDLAFNKITKRTILEFKVYLSSDKRKTPKNLKAKKKLGSRGINYVLYVLRSYFNFLISMDYKCPISPLSVKTVKSIKNHYRLPELEDVVRLIESPTKIERNKIIALRNRAMLETLFSTGMRISELLNLKKNQVDKRGKVFIQGKGKKERFVYLTPRAQKHIKKYLDLREFLDKNTESLFLFIPYSGANSLRKDKKISPVYLQMKIKRYREWLGLNIPITAHGIRHAYATYLAENGASIPAIQHLLGHESLSTTSLYVNTSDRYAEKELMKFHPLKK